MCCVFSGLAWFCHSCAKPIVIYSTFIRKCLKNPLSFSGKYKINALKSSSSYKTHWIKTKMYASYMPFYKLHSIRIVCVRKCAQVHVVYLCIDLSLYLRSFFIERVLYVASTRKCILYSHIRNKIYSVVYAIIKMRPSVGLLKMMENEMMKKNGMSCFSDSIIKT